MVHLGSICPTNNSLSVGRVAVQSSSPLYSDSQAVKHTMFRILCFLDSHYAPVTSKIFKGYLLVLHPSVLMVLKFWRSSVPQKGLVKHRWLCPPHRAPDSVGLEWHLRVCISNKCPGDPDGTGPETTLWEPLHLSQLLHYSYFRLHRIRKVKRLMSYRNISVSLNFLDVHIWRHALPMCLLGL